MHNNVHVHVYNICMMNMPMLVMNDLVYKACTGRHLCSSYIRLDNLNLKFRITYTTNIAR